MSQISFGNFGLCFSGLVLSAKLLLSIFIAKMWSAWRSHVAFEMFCFYVNSLQAIEYTVRGFEDALTHLCRIRVITISEKRKKTKISQWNDRKMAPPNVYVVIILTWNHRIIVCLFGRCHRWSKFRSRPSILCSKNIAPKYFKRKKKEELLLHPSVRLFLFGWTTLNGHNKRYHLHL